MVSWPGLVEAMWGVLIHLGPQSLESSYFDQIHQYMYIYWTAFQHSYSCYFQSISVEKVQPNCLRYWCNEIWIPLQNMNFANTEAVLYWLVDLFKYSLCIILAETHSYTLVRPNGRPVKVTRSMLVCLFVSSLVAGGHEPAQSNRLSSTERRLQSSTERRDECVNMWSDTKQW